MTIKQIKEVLIGKSLNPLDQGIFHNLSLIAFFAWVGLGVDGLSSSCYGPEEAFLALGSHTYLSIFVAVMTATTVFVISASYSQIIELFPAGGGGYLVASKLLSPAAGMVSGCALLLDYLLTIAISIASGTDALFSFLPPEWHAAKLQFAVCGVIILTILNTRGVKESIVPLVPIFLTFVITHFFIILYATVTHVSRFPELISATHVDIQSTYGEVGLWGMIFLILKAYSLGAGTYTGIEAVSNGMTNLREPRIQTGKRTMRYMSISLAFTVTGLMLAYLFYNIHAQPGKTLNAALFERIAEDHGPGGRIFVLVSLLSEAFILFIAAQTGFLGGPRVLANMAIDRWFPTKFASLSDRLVTQNGILLMGGAAFVTMILTKGSVKLLVVLYSINVFITFFLSQLGMVKHWWNERVSLKAWYKKIVISVIALVMTAFILVSVVVMKFHEGGWATIVITAMLIILAVVIKKHYNATARELRRLNSLVESVNQEMAGLSTSKNKLVDPKFDPLAKTAVIMVNGFNGLGLHTLFNVIRFFGKEFRNFIFVEIGIVDAGNFKGASEVENLQKQIKSDIGQYVQFMKKQGCYAEGLTFTGTDVMHAIEETGPALTQKYPGAVFFGGQLVFDKETLFTKWLHNYTVFAMQRRFYTQGIPFVILPIRV